MKVKLELLSPIYNLAMEPTVLHYFVSAAEAKASREGLLVGFDPGSLNWRYGALNHSCGRYCRSYADTPLAVTEPPACGGGVVAAEGKPHCRLSCLLASCKQLCQVRGDLTLVHLMLILFKVLVTASSAVVKLACALLPISQYLFLILIYAVECLPWIWREEQLYLKVLKVSSPQSSSG